jgi:hypothetical protein
MLLYRSDGGRHKVIRAEREREREREREIKREIDREREMGGAVCHNFIEETWSGLENVQNYDRDG